MHCLESSNFTASYYPLVCAIKTELKYHQVKRVSQAPNGNYQYREKPYKK